jgi:hypothetical protein
MTIENDRRVGSVETKYDAENGIFNNMFSMSLLFVDNSVLYKPWLRI